MNALILVDLQNDFLPGGALAVPESDRVIPIVNRLMDHFELVVATQDWHPANHGSFAANHPNSRLGEVIDLHGLPQVLWPVHCVAGTAGAEFSPELDVSQIDRVFRKGTDPMVDSYSGFFDNGRRRSTGLAEFFKEREVSDVFVCGLATDYCVKSTALDSIGSGCRTHLIVDACRGVDLKPGDVNDAMETMRAAGVIVMQSNDLCRARTA